MELNAEQIKKALECCICEYDDKDCTVCPYHEKETHMYCTIDLMRDALALITSQEQRIGVQDMVISNLRKLLEKANHDADRYAVKIKELTEEYESMAKSVNEASELIRKLRADKEELTEENERLRCERAKFFEYKHGTLVRNALVLTKNKKEFDDFCGAIKADTVRKMQERLKEWYHFKYKGKMYVAITDEEIDQIAKEMLEGLK